MKDQHSGSAVTRPAIPASSPVADWLQATDGVLGEVRVRRRRTPRTAVAIGEEGWERAAGTTAEHVAYWDAVAALNTPTKSDDGYQTGGWAPLLDGAAATERRDAFLEAALTEVTR